MDPTRQLSERLTSALHLTTAPIAITFSEAVPAGIEPFGGAMPAPTPDGRTGREPAGCVFWNHAATRTFATVAVAKEQGRVAASVGCALSRARTGMAASDFMCAIPGARLGEVVDAIERAAAVDAGVARYAGDDAERFASSTR